MPIPTLITDLSTTASSNSPAGSDSPATLDDIQRAHASFIAQLRDGAAALPTATGASLVGYQPTGGTATTVQAKLRESVSVKDFGAVGDGVTNDSAAITAAIAAGNKSILVQGMVLIDGLILESLNGVTFYGDGNSAFTWTDGRFAIKSPTNVKFKDIGFVAVAHDTKMPTIFVSNFSGITFENCEFRGFGGAAVNKANSTCLWLYAGDTVSSTTAAGNSSGALVTNCKFYGNGRMTNFAIRVFTEFGTPGAATNSSNIVTNNLFEGFNWNAVEIGGPATFGNVISSCVAYGSGLTPFDLDKGTHDNLIDGVVINRMLGNIDTGVNPNTRITVCGVQGITALTGYSYNNRITGVVANLLAADLLAYGKEAVCVGLAYAQNNVIDDISVYCDAVPIRNAGKNFGLAIACKETAAGNIVRDVQTVNASAGLWEVGSQNAAMTSSEPNIFEDIRNIGTMTEELAVFNKGASAGGFSRSVVRRFTAATSMSNPSITTTTNRYAVHMQASGSSSHFAKLTDSTLTIPASASIWFVFDAIPKLGLSNLVINENGAPLLPTRFIHSESSTVPSHLGLQNITCNFGQDPLDLATSLQYLDSTCGIYAEISDIGLPVSEGNTLFASAQPSYPAAVNYHTSLHIERITKVAGSYEGWINVGGVWKTYGSISA